MSKRHRPERPQSVDVGSSFGRLTVIRFRQTNHRGQGVWLCRCECGNEDEYRASKLVGGLISSCGCLYRDSRRTIRLIHGDKPKGRKVAPEYTAWTNMITRCTNPKHNRWQHYGGRGIAICDQWRNSYEAFLADVGRRPSHAHSIDRYPDCDGNYEPGNVRWATGTEQRLNQRRQKAA